MCDTGGKKPSSSQGICDAKPPKADPCCKKPGPVAGVPTGGGGIDFKGLVELPRFLRIIGPKQMTIARLFTPTMAYYSLAGLLFTMYFCDWKAVLQYLPFWNGKYKTAFDENAAYEAAMAKKKLLDPPPTVQEEVPKCE